MFYFHFYHSSFGDCLSFHFITYFIFFIPSRCPYTTYPVNYTSTIHKLVKYVGWWRCHNIFSHTFDATHNCCQAFVFFFIFVFKRPHKESNTDREDAEFNWKNGELNWIFLYFDGIPISWLKMLMWCLNEWKISPLKNHNLQLVLRMLHQREQLGNERIRNGHTKCGTERGVQHTAQHKNSTRKIF